MTPADAAFVRDFEAGRVESFHHRDHVRLAWAYLEQEPPARALDRFATALKAFATSRGKPELYHETITWAFLLLIQERRAQGSPVDFEAFAVANPDLLAWKPSILDRYYRQETLGSELSRRVFLMPDYSLGRS